MWNDNFLSFFKYLPEMLLSLVALNYTLGVRYERVNPNYRTLGAYFFNNDLENITINSLFSLFKDKLTLNSNIGRQRDNLNNQNLKQSIRWVGSINANYKASEKLNLTGTYSNFTMFSNTQQNQFTNINNNPLQVQQPKDSISFNQVSQNGNVAISYTLANTQKHIQNLNATYSISDVVNKENGFIRKGGISRFHNANVSYTLALLEKKMNVTTSINYTNSYAASQTSTILGPNVMVDKLFLKDKLKTNAGLSYNVSNSQTAKIEILNITLGANFEAWKKHNFNFALIQSNTNSNQTQANASPSETTATFGYNYNF